MKRQDNITSTTRSLLMNFKVDEDIIDLGDDLIIRRIPRDKFTDELCRDKPFGEVIERYYGKEILDYAENSDLHDFWFVESHTKVKLGIQNFPFIHDYGSKVNNELLKALRLFKNKSIRFGWEYSITDNLAPMMSEGERSVWRVIYVGGDEHKYKLDEQEVEDFKVFWRKYKGRKINSYPSLKIAINRFNSAYESSYDYESSYERENFENRFLDCIIGIEALYLHGGEVSELKYKIALRAAFVLGNSVEERSEIFRRLRYAYDIRSKIVHGNPLDKVIKQTGCREYLLKKINETTDEFISKICEYLRLSILKFIDLAQEKNKKKIEELLDTQILEGKKL